MTPYTLIPANTEPDLPPTQSELREMALKAQEAKELEHVFPPTQSEKDNPTCEGMAPGSGWKTSGPPKQSTPDPTPEAARPWLADPEHKFTWEEGDVQLEPGD